MAHESESRLCVNVLTGIWLPVLFWLDVFLLLAGKLVSCIFNALVNVTVVIQSIACTVYLGSG